MAWECYLSLAPAGSDTASVRQMMETVFFQQYPMALLYRGVMLFVNREYDQAIGSWERYLQVASTENERAQARSLIARARAELGSTDIAKR